MSRARARNRAGQSIAQARLALILLTRLPMGQLAEPAPSLASARWAFPLVGVVVGLIGWAGHAGAFALGLGPVIAALVAVGAMVLATGALHLDGVADFADGVGGGQDRARILEIMRDSRIGTFGALALGFALALQTAAIGRIAPAALPWALVMAAVSSRLAMLLVLDLLAPARRDGLGRMAAGSDAPEGARAPAWRGAWVPGGLVAGGLAFWAGPAGLAGLAGAGLGAWLVARLAWRRIGGQTGDVLGAAQVSAELCCLLVLAALLAG